MRVGVVDLRFPQYFYRPPARSVWSECVRKNVRRLFVSLSQVGKAFFFILRFSSFSFFYCSIFSLLTGM